MDFTPQARPQSTRIRIAELDALLQDQEAGGAYQRDLHPKDPPPIPGYELAVVYRPARRVSGDFYDFLPLSGGRWGLVVADASGKGVPAALLTMTCRALLRSQPEPDAGPARVLSNTNRALLGNIRRGMFVSGIYAAIDPAAHVLQVANAGHLPLIVWRARAKIATIHPSRSPVLGMLPGDAYDRSAQEESIPLEVGDRFVMFTDGVNEAMAPGEKEFGMEQLRRRLRGESDGPSDQFLRHLVDQLDIHRAGGDPSDDITILTGRRLR
jgi:sigma-B regulation protein RsbU (phosphoserine phosphatase)